MDRVPDWVIERYVLGELPEQRLQEMERRLAEEPELQERVTALRASNEQILDQMPPRVFAATVDQLAQHDTASERAPSMRWMVMPLLAVAAAMLLAVPLLEGGLPWEPDPEEGTRLKGDAHVVLHRQAAGGAVALVDGASAQQGDLLQLSVQGSGYAYGAVLSLDGRGTVTVHHPRGGSAAAELSLGSTVPLGQSYELDDAPDFERFFLVVSQDPFEVGMAQDAVADLAVDLSSARTADLELPDRFVHSSVLLVKE